MFSRVNVRRKLKEYLFYYLFYFLRLIKNIDNSKKVWDLPKIVSYSEDPTTFFVSIHDIFMLLSADLDSH